MKIISLQRLSAAREENWGLGSDKDTEFAAVTAAVAVVVVVVVVSTAAVAVVTVVVVAAVVVGVLVAAVVVVSSSSRSALSELLYQNTCRKIHCDRFIDRYSCFLYKMVF